MHVYQMYPALRKRLVSWYTRLHQGIALIGWVMLGLGLIALLVDVLATSPGWLGPILFGPKASAVFVQKMSIIYTPIPFPFPLSIFSSIFSTLLPVIVTLLCYSLLTFTYPRLFSQPRGRIYYIAAVSIAMLFISLILLPTLSNTLGENNQHYIPSQLQFCVFTYAVAAHARVTFSKKASWLVEAIVLLFALLCLTLGSTHSFGHITIHADGLPPQDMQYQTADSSSGQIIYDQDQWSLQIPLLGVKVGGVNWFFQFGIWFLGLLCLHVFTGIGVHERTARQKSDALVKELTAAQEQLRAYALHAEDVATMRERSRVAREVHDTLAQGLAAIKMHLETGTTLFYEQPELAYKHMERARELAGEHLHEARTSILNLRTDALKGHTLPSALTKTAQAWQSDRSATFCVSGIAEDSPFWLTLSPAIELACYRIVQEALSNAAKHGHARHAEVELSLENDELCLTITDDGCGFAPATINPHAQSGGFGIIGMHERLKLLNGRLEILSAPGAGTQVVAMLPVTQHSLEAQH
jgi:signal transduction histidine kinase